MNVKTGLKLVFGTAIFAAVMALLMGITRNWGAMLGAMAVSLGFFGLTWAGRRMLLPDPEKGPINGISLIIKVMFGGAGLAMIIGGVFLFVDGDFGAALAMLIFGGIFCAVAYFGSRVFAGPKGVKAVLTGGGTKSIQGVSGQSGTLTQLSGIYVDEKTGDAEIEQMRKNWVEKPWTQRQDWACGKMVQEGTLNMGLLVVFTVLWNIFGWGIAAFGIISDWDSGDVPWFLVVFPVVGVVLAVVTLRAWIRKRKFGTSVLNFRTMPAYSGDHLQGTVQTGVPVKNQPSQEFSLRLLCARRTTVLDQDGDARVSEETLWSDQQTVLGGISGTLPVFQVSVDFHIPGNLPSTELLPEDDRTLWRLEITSRMKGVDYAAQFEVPVYQRPEAAGT